MKSLLIAITLSAMTSVTGWAHGEEKPGPHGGYIRMPGMFHTEVVQMNPQQIKVYLLDMEWKNPSIQKSSLKVLFSEAKKSQKNPTVATCKTSGDFFICEFGKKTNLTKTGKILLTAEREGQKGVEIEYETPLAPHH